MALLRPSLPPGESFGVLAEFASPTELYHACEGVRDAGYTRWDAHTPFPVHGLDRAMGIKPSRLPWVVLVMAVGGALAGIGLQGWVSTTAYPLVISGKPFFSWPAFIPVTFELSVLGGALGAVFGMFAMNQLPTLYHPLFSKASFERATDDGFFLSIESWDPKFDSDRTVELLRRLGAKEVELVSS
ncbi:MAG TPA: DUF3341 domain-containing protein [Thermoanaerobaculia bacterium]|jgi:hypothetical protein|nr:DUF3341 domain-containing protein [Thermoanaerobaculia bacterium]